MEAKLEARAKRLLALFDGARVKATYGMELSYSPQGEAVFYMGYNPAFDHAGGGVFGGVLAALLDNAGWFAVALHYDSWLYTAEFQSRMLDPAERTDLIATGRLLRAGKRLAVAQMEVRSPGGLLHAVGSGSFVVTGRPMPLGQVEGGI